MTYYTLRRKSPTAAAPWLALTLFFCAAGAREARGQSPQTDPFPVPEDTSRDRAIHVRLAFSGPEQVSLVSAEVIRGRPPQRISAPPLLLVRLYRGRDCLAEEFNAWHPLWVFAEKESGGERLEKLGSAEADFFLPFDREITRMDLISGEDGRRLISVNLTQVIPAFCRQTPSDPSCLTPDFFRLPLLHPLTFILFAPRTLRVGQNISEKVRASVCNVGGETIPGADFNPDGGYRLTLVLSRDKRLPTRRPSSAKCFREDAAFDGSTVLATKTLAPGAAASYRFKASIPVNTPPGDYCLGLLLEAGGGKGGERLLGTCQPIRISAR